MKPPGPERTGLVRWLATGPDGRPAAKATAGLMAPPPPAASSPCRVTGQSLVLALCAAVVILGLAFRIAGPDILSTHAAAYHAAYTRSLHHGGRGFAAASHIESLVLSRRRAPRRAVADNDNGLEPESSPRRGNATSRQGLGRPDRQAAALWRSIEAAVYASGSHDVIDPGVREGPDPTATSPQDPAEFDFVEAGIRLPAAWVARARGQWQGFLQRAPGYPDPNPELTPKLSPGITDSSPPRPPVFDGRGIVICAGGLKYTIPAWISIRLLRRNGCTLPVELWFFRHELPTRAFARSFRKMGVTCRAFEDVMGPGVAMLLWGNRNVPYAVKALALLLSRFREVLLLDADNMAVQDPAFLFSSPPYLESGAVVWPDFWNATVSPDFYALFGREASTGPQTSHESGQMLFDKARAWRPLLLALLFNIQGRLYYKLLSDYMGQGDKETFALAFYALGLPIHEVATPVGSVGRVVPFIKRGLSCFEPYPHPITGALSCFVGNSMMQHVPGRAGRIMGPPGKPPPGGGPPAPAPRGGGYLFLHANLPKWTLKFAYDFGDYQRRWEALQPQNASPSRRLTPREFLNATAGLGYDPERACYEAMRALRELPAFIEYLEQRRTLYGEKVPARMRIPARVQWVEGFIFDWMQHPRSAHKAATTRHNPHNAFRTYYWAFDRRGRPYDMGYKEGYLAEHWMNYVARGFPRDNALGAAINL